MEFFIRGVGGPTTLRRRRLVSRRPLPPTPCVPLPSHPRCATHPRGQAPTPSPLHPPPGDERFFLTSSDDHSVRMWAMDAQGRPSLAATFGQLPWTLADPASHTPVTPVRAGRASVRFGAGFPGGGSEAAEAPETVSGEVEEVATDPTGLAAFVESVEMGGEEGGEEKGEEGGGGGLASPSSSRDLRTKAIIDNILARGKDARAGGGGGGGAAMLGGRGSLSHNPVMHRLKVHRLAEVKPRTPR
eukprot:scaffold4195_cov92-Isochrysis_galbana.AAC.6